MTAQSTPTVRESKTTWWCCCSTLRSAGRRVDYSWSLHLHFIQHNYRMSDAQAVTLLFSKACVRRGGSRRCSSLCGVTMLQPFFFFWWVEVMFSMMLRCTLATAVFLFLPVPLCSKAVEESECAFLIIERNDCDTRKSCIGHIEITIISQKLAMLRWDCHETAIYYDSFIWSYLFKSAPWS